QRAAGSPRDLECLIERAIQVVGLVSHMRCVETTRLGNHAGQGAELTHVRERTWGVHETRGRAAGALIKSATQKVTHSIELLSCPRPLRFADNLKSDGAEAHQGSNVDTQSVTLEVGSVAPEIRPANVELRFEKCAVTACVLTSIQWKGRKPTVASDIG